MYEGDVTEAADILAEDQNMLRECKPVAFGTLDSGVY
jgi:hypothetical protein